MSVTDDGIPHGLEGYRKFGCKCDDGTVKSCKGANREYNRQQQARRDKEKRDSRKAAKDELAAKRERRSAQGRAAAARNFGHGSSQDDSVPKRAKKIGEMEQAVIDAATKLGALEDKPDIVMLARNMARILDNPKQVALHPSTNRQLMALMGQIRGTDSSGSKRKSRGRLATVQRMTKSKRAVAQ
jgi:hypothetical protein